MMIKEILPPRWGLSPRKDPGVNNDKIGRTDPPDPGPSGRGRGNLREFLGEIPANEWVFPLKGAGLCSCPLCYILTGYAKLSV